jgi:hypothetical protein
MPRITKESVREAYDKVKLQPTQHSYFSQGKCCPIGALALACGEVSIMDNFSARAGRARKWANIYYGPRYVDGFLLSLDDGYTNNFPNEEFEKGYEDGVKIREFIRHV